MVWSKSPASTKLVACPARARMTPYSVRWVSCISTTWTSSKRCSQRALNVGPGGERRADAGRKAQSGGGGPFLGPADRFVQRAGADVGERQPLANHGPQRLLGVVLVEDDEVGGDAEGLGLGTLPCGRVP